ncbi:MAG TPA: zf-HC2 domain-containing protein [Blastocatellia bacterium]|nr:zf-HC2 domain-containing protein [Blastocatellia bacterium]
MSEHLTARQIECYYNRLMSPAELLVALDHVAECNTCREQFEPEQRIHEVGDALRSDLQAQAQYSNHLTYEDSAAYVDECLGEIEREIVESHLDLCGQCATEIADLRAFRAEMTTYPEIERVPARPSTGRIISFWRAAAFRIPIQLAAAASILLVCGLIATLLLRKDSSRLTEVSELQQPNETPQPQPPPVETQKIPEANASSQAVYEIQDGAGSVTLDKEGKITGLETLPLSYRQAVEAGLTNKGVERPAALQGLVGRTGSLMGGRGEDTTFSLIGPIGTVVKSDKPTFRWNALSGATSYAITVYDPNFNKVTASEQQPGTEWTPSQPLERGALYSWQVTAVREGKEIMSPTPPAPDAKFKVLETSTAKELENAKRTYAQSHLVLGILYERAGLIDDAEREFKSLYRANPKSQIVRKLLRDVQSLRQPSAQSK